MNWIEQRNVWYKFLETHHRCGLRLRCQSIVITVGHCSRGGLSLNAEVRIDLYRPTCVICYSGGAMQTFASMWAQDQRDTKGPVRRAMETTATCQMQRIMYSKSRNWQFNRFIDSAYFEEASMIPLSLFVRITRVNINFHCAYMTISDILAISSADCISMLCAQTYRMGGLREQEDMHRASEPSEHVLRADTVLSTH
jgi:hypothetical protein